MKDLRAAFHGQRREETAYSPNTPISPDLPPSFPIWYLLKSDAAGTPAFGLPAWNSLLAPHWPTLRGPAHILPPAAHTTFSFLSSPWMASVPHIVALNTGRKCVVE